MTEENKNNEKKFGEKETSENISKNLKEIEELDKEIEERRKKEKEKVLPAAQKNKEKRDYRFKKDPSELFKRKKLKHFTPGGKGEKQMMKVVAGRGIKGIKPKKGEEFVRGLKKFADESVKTSTKPATLKKITVLNYLKQLKEEKHGPFKRSQIRRIRETFFSPTIQTGPVGERGKSKDKNAKFSVSRRVDKSFDNRGRTGRVGGMRRTNK